MGCWYHVLMPLLESTPYRNKNTMLDTVMHRFLVEKTTPCDLRDRGAEQYEQQLNALR